MNTKLVLTALGLATLVAVPASAQDVRSNYSRTRAYNSVDAYASATRYPSGAYGAYHMIGTDPDPAIRSELQRDWPTYTTGN